MALQFSKSGDPGIEKSYRTHYVSPALSEKKQQRLQEKLNQSPKPVVFQNLREAQCSECGAEIEQGSLLSMELEQPLCLRCARLDDLEFLPSGDTALTRRATKYSGRVAVVVRFSRSRGVTRGRVSLWKRQGSSRLSENAWRMPTNVPWRGHTEPRGDENRMLNLPRK